MQRFDCLSPDIPVLGPHFLEASAGTGKTFAIEHVFARLLSHMELDQILVVTFTKAATRELKKRIRATIRGQEAAKKFDEAQIFTIHGFCMRMLQDHGLEAGLPLGLSQENPDSRIEAALKDFFEFECPKLVAPEQLRHLVKDSVAELANELRIQEPKKVGSCFVQRWHEFQQVLKTWDEPIPELPSLFQEIRPRYKASVGNFEKQIEDLYAAFQNKDNPLFFRNLIFPAKKVLSFLKPENLKVKFKDSVLPPIFEWACQRLSPHIETASDFDEVFADLLAVWKPIQRQILLEEGGITPDEILRLMGLAVEAPQFRNLVRGRYKAVLIDEFQDTDPLQWKIFSSLFLGQVEAFYLIGDPKQSIYRFRNADLYTYLEAKSAFGPDFHFHLDTNYRSSEEMIRALNRLFNRNWLTLPKLSSSLPYIPMKAGILDIPSIQDGNGAVHFYSCTGSSPDYVAREILRLYAETKSFNAFAVLVKDRYELAEYLKSLRQYGIPVVGKTRLSITQTLAFESLYEWIDAVRFYQDIGKAKRVLAGPLGGYSAQEIETLEDSPFPELRSILDEKGVIAALRSHLSSLGVLNSSFQADLDQVLELFFSWVEKHGFQFERAEHFFQTLMQKHPDELPIQRGEGDQDGVQIMTMHASKGLEFEIVFASGLGSKCAPDDEEASAEILRQLYVAMTRAKRRLYVPVPSDQKILSPVSLFLNCIPKEELEELKSEQIISWETADLSRAPPAKFKLDSPSFSFPEYQIDLPSPSYLLSFSSLAQEAEEFTTVPFEESVAEEHTKHNLPRGTDVGVFIHGVFEKIFLSGKWHQTETIERIVQEQIAFTKWAPWKEAICQMISESLSTPIEDGWSLTEISPDKACVETEFLFQQENHFVKGFIDLIVERNGKIYFIDWKTNWLGPSDESYSDEAIEKVLHAHQYHLQASIYARAILQGWDIDPKQLGGAIYLFVRAPKAVFWRPAIYE